MPLFLAACAMLLIARPAMPVAAHANLVRSNPAAGAVLATAPAQVQLWFSEQPDPHFSDVQVIDAQSSRFDAGDMHPAPGDSLSLIVDLKPLPDGLYTIVWKTVSAVDGHVVSGSIPFYVGQPPQGAALPTATQLAPASGGLPGPGAVLDRWLGLLSAVVLAGGFAFWALALVPGVMAVSRASADPMASGSGGNVSAGDGVPAAIASRVLVVLTVAWVLVAVATGVSLVQQTMTASGAGFVRALGSPLRTELLHTRFGHVLWLRAAATTMSGLLLVVWTRSRCRASRSVVIAGAGWLAVEGVLLAYSLNSHGAALTSQSSLATTADFVHVSAAGLWLGGLAQFVLSVPACLKSLGPARRLAFLATVVPRFSNLALGSVAAIVATGVYQAVRQLPGWGAFTDTGYGRTLLVKLGLFLPALGLAGLNLLFLKPALARAARGDTVPARSLLPALRPLRLERGFFMSVGAESLLGLAILGVVGLLVNQPPARTTVPTVPGIHLTARAQGVSVRLTVDPGMLGLNQFSASVSDSGQPPPDGTQVVLRLTYLDQDRGTSEVAMQAQGKGLYTAQSADLSAYGTWGIVALVQPPAADEVRTDFKLALAQGEASGAGSNAATGTSVATGRKLYQANCARCHGATAHGDGPEAKRYDPPPVDLVIHVPQHSDQQLLGWITNGIPTTAMPAFKDKLSDTDRQAVLNFLRTLSPTTPTPAPGGGNGP